MSPIAQDLDAMLSTLDPQTARKVEQLVRDALQLASDARRAKVGEGHWPAHYFEHTSGALAGEQFERPTQQDFETRENW